MSELAELRPPTPTTYAGFSRERASRAMIDVCRIAAETGQTLLAAQHLNALAKRVT